MPRGNNHGSRIQRKKGKGQTKVFSSNAILNSKKRNHSTKLSATAPPSKKARSKPTHDSEEDDSDHSEESVDGGSDSEGNEWRLGEVDSDDDSDIDSDDAMGESDEERFADFTFRGSSTSKNKKKGRKAEKELDLDEDDDDGSENEEEEEEEGEYIDVIDMLDRKTPESESGLEEGEESEVEAKESSSKRKRAGSSDLDDKLDLGGDSDESEGSEGPESDSESDGGDTTSSTGFSEEEDDTPEDLDKMDALQELISSLPSSERPAKRARLEDPNEQKRPGEYNLTLPSENKKLTIQDLMPSVTDPTLKKSLKLMADDVPKPNKKNGVPGKLSVPLAKRQQDRIDRAVVAKQTKETLDRWVDTVKHNREADHLHFPLASDPSAPVGPAKKFDTITATSTPLTALESTISTILKDSNMASDKEIKEFEELKTNKMSLEEVQKRTAELRLARELMYREEVKAKRLKKIKSKSYHRIKRKERQRQHQSLEEALAEKRGGEPDPEEEMEMEKRRAEERMSLRHKQSRWAQGVKQSGRGAWDDDARDGAHEMARRADELKRRIRGKEVDGSDDDGTDEESESSDEFDEKQQVLKAIRETESIGSESNSNLGTKLMNMKFMRQAEAAKRKENEAAIQSLREDWEAAEGEESDDENDDSAGVAVKGRTKFGPTKSTIVAIPPKKAVRNEFEAPDNSSDDDDNDEDEDEEEDEVQITNKASASGPKRVNPFSIPSAATSNTGGYTNKKTEVEQEFNPWLAQTTGLSSKSKPKGLENGKQESKSARAGRKLSKVKDAMRRDEPAAVDIDMDINLPTKPAPVNSDEEKEENVQMVPTKGKNTKTQRELIKKAFAGDNVVSQFAKEKNQTIEGEDDKVIDDTLPGWGRWTGAGLSNHEEKKNKGRVMRKVAGVAKDQRKDAKLNKVIINEKRVKKNTTFNATQLPHPFESKAQYERSMRLPIGPEWTTKKTFQQATMPRVMVKQGRVVEAISAPFK